MRTEKQSLYKRGNIWWFCYTSNGAQFHKSTKTGDRVAAEKIKREYINNVNGPVETRQVFIFDYVVLKFLEEKIRTIRENTNKLYKFHIKNILPFFTEKIINDIKKMDIKNYENFRLMNNCKEGLLLKELKLLKSIFNFAKENELITDNLFDNYKFNKVYKDYEPRERYLTKAECELLINSCNEYLKRLVITLLETGMRINEALNLLFTDIAFDNNKVFFARIRKEISKSKRERFIPLSKLAMEQINKQKIEFPNSMFIFTDKKGNNYKTTPKKAFGTAKKKAGLNDIGGFHTLRHTFASLKLQQGKSIELIAEIMGHQSIDLTKKVYAKFDKETLIKIL